MCGSWLSCVNTPIDHALWPLGQREIHLVAHMCPSHLTNIYKLNAEIHVSNNEFDSNSAVKDSYKLTRL